MKDQSANILQVRHIWYTVQGEGPYAGHAAVFIRLTGCNLRCTFCDTEWDDKFDGYRNVIEIVNYVKHIAPEHCKFVVLTGGEPTRQPLSKLIPDLLDAGFKVQIETAGSFWQECMSMDGVTIVVSPKLSKVHPNIWYQADAWKYVIQYGHVAADGLPKGSTQINATGSSPRRPPKGAQVYLQPCDEPNLLGDNERLVAELAMKHGYIAGLQMHKIWNVD